MVDMRTREGRAVRENETRESETRQKAWQPPGLLPDPPHRDGIRHRWVRTSTMGVQDPGNVSMRFREGWVPVKKVDYPEMAVVTDFNSKFPENIEIGGLLLCQIDDATAQDRQRHFEEKARDQMKAMDRNWLREQADPRMPLLKPERTSRTTFGSGNAPR